MTVPGCDSVASPARTSGEAVENARPILYVVVATFKSNALYAYCIRVQLRQRVSLSRGNLSHLYWERTKTGMVGTNNLRDVTDSVLDFVDRFSNDYLAANPQLAEFARPPPVWPARTEARRNRRHPSRISIA